MTLVYASFMTFMQIPMMEIIIANFFLDFSGSSSVLRVLIYCFASLNSLFFLLMTVFLYKLYIIRIPCQSIAWSASNTQLHFMKVINKVLLVACHLYMSSTGENILILQSVVLILFLGTGVLRILIIPHYSKLVDWITRITELVSSCLMLMVLLSQSVMSDLKMCVTLGLLTIPLIIVSSLILDIFRKQQLLSKLEAGTLRLEIEYEYMLYLMIEMARNSMGWDNKSQYQLSNILYLIDVHNRSCQNFQCPCHMRQIVQYLLNKGFLKDQTTIEVEEEEINFLNSAGEDVFIQTNKNSTHSKTFTVFQVYNFYQDYGDNKHQMEEDKSKKQTIQINLNQLKLTFLNKFIENYFEDAQKKFPKSKRLFFQYAYFTLYSCQNSFLTETLIRNFDNLKVNWLEQVSIKVNELQTVMEIRQTSILNSNHEEEGAQSSISWGIMYESDIKLNYGSKLFGTDMFDPEHFILMSLLTNKYYNIIEKLTQNIQTFWKKIQSDSLDVYNSYVEGVKVAKTISKIYEIFEEIEDESKRLDFRLYYVFALIQKFLLNDLNAHDMYLNKMNSQRDINRLIRSNMLQAKPEDTGFMLVHGQDKNFGKVILCNQIFRKNMQYTQKDLKHANITNFMPMLIKNWHQKFVSDFDKSGVNGVLGRNTCVFVIKKNGYAVPAMMNVRFHYSKDYEFTFICFLTFMTEIQVQKNAQKHKVDQVLFFLCDDQDGRIHDISESCFKQLAFNVQYLHSNDLGSIVNHLTIEDICPALSLRKIKELRRNSDSLAAIEELVDLNLNIMQELNNNQKAYNNKVQKALCQVFQEQYGLNKDKCVNIVAIILLDQKEMQRYLGLKHNARNNKRKEEQKRIKQEEEEKKHVEELESQSVPGSSGSSQQRDSFSGSSGSRTGTTTEVLKQIYSSTERKTPQSLKLIAQLIFVVFVIMIVISTINLILALQRSDNLVTEVNTVRKSYDRIVHHAKTRLLLRGMINMANGYEPLTSEISTDRFQMFQNELVKQISKLKNVQDFLDKVQFEYSDEFKTLVNAKVVELQYLDEYNKKYTENQTHSFANNLYIQRISEVQNWKITDLKGKIQLMNILSPPVGYKPTDKERTAYFLITNAQDNLRYYDQVFSNFYKDETIAHALDVTAQTQITIIVSIISIVVVSLVISPIICRIEERKYIGLKFFIFVEHSHIAVLLQSCEDFLQLAFSDSSVHTGNTHQETNIIESKKQRNKLDNQNNFMDSDQVQALKNQQDESKSDSHQRQGGLDDSSDSSLRDYASMYSSVHVENGRRRKSGGSESDGIENYLQQNIIQSAKAKISGVKMASYISQIGSSKITHPSQVLDQQEEQALDEVQENPQQNEGEMLSESQVTNNNQMEQSYHTLKDLNAKEETYVIDQKKLQMLKFLGIRQIIRRKKIIIVVLIGLIALLVSSYFIACYFLAEKSFSQTPDIIKNLDLLFFKDACLENSMAFVRENSILNYSIPLVEDKSKVASSYFIKDCQERENQYISIRKNTPSVFSEIKDYIEDLESSKICSVTYTTKELIDQCDTVYYGVLKKGVSYTMSLMLSHYQNVQMNFDISPRARTFEKLLEYNKDSQTLRLAEAKDFILDQVFFDLKDKATISTTNYYSTLISYYTILYGIFVVAMTAFIMYFFIYSYKSIKDTMWKSNLTLKIMPMDFIPKQCLPDLKKFFNS